MATIEPWHTSPVLRIDPTWVDYNGHLNQAYYIVLFDRALDEALLPVGLGPDYIATRNLSFFTVESHICYVREMFQTDPVRVRSRVLDVDEKRLHRYCEMIHAEDGWLTPAARERSASGVDRVSSSFSRNSRISRFWVTVANPSHW